MGQESREAVDGYKVIYKGGQGEITEKKSRFIATIRPVETEEEATAFIAEMKKKYWDARHNCSAFVLGSRQELTRCSDDGEPPQTAGRPMLDVLLRQGITNAAVVVTRYFGGVLLGTGGLVRAYQGAVQEGLMACEILWKRQGYRLQIHTDYTGLGKLQYLFAQKKLPVVNTEYGADVWIQVMVPENEIREAENAVTEQTGGKAQIDRGDPVTYGVLDDQVMIF